VRVYLLLLLARALLARVARLVQLVARAWWW
jgi:hypothetical protein